MSLQIIWRNPNPPPRVKFKLRRLAQNGTATLYQIASPNYRYPFELLQKAAGSLTGLMPPLQRSTARVTPSSTELVSARW